MIYFQVIDRTVRTFLNEIMPRLPVASGAGETPPGLTDALIFYDPLVAPTRPGVILPAALVALLEAGQKPDAEKMLVELIRDAAMAKAVEHEGEIDMLTIEEEEHRSRLKQIETRRAHLKEMSDNLSASISALREWTPAEPVAADPNDASESAESSATDVSAPDSESGPSSELSFYAQIAVRVRGIMAKTGGMLTASDFDDGFRQMMDMGLAPTVNAEKEIAEAADAARSQTRRVMFVSDYLVSKFVQTYQLTQAHELEEALAAVRQEWEQVNNRLSKLQKKRMDVLRVSGVNLSSELDRLMLAQYRYFVLETKRRRLALSADEKRQYGILTSEIDGIERKIDTDLYLRFHSSSDFLSTFQRLRQAILQSLHELIEIEENEREKKEIHDKLSAPFRTSSPTARIVAMEEQILRLNQFAKLLMGRGRKRPFTPVQPPPWPVTASAVLTAVEKVHAADHTLFPEKFLRRRGGPPAILLFPCFGSGLYDWRDGLLVISMYPENLQTAILTAIAEFRLDADDSKELFNSFGADIKRNKNMGFVRLKELFVADYTAWMSKEAAGFRVMEKDVRAWFERKIPLTISGRSDGRKAGTGPSDSRPA